MGIEDALPLARVDVGSKPMLREGGLAWLDDEGHERLVRLLSPTDTGWRYRHAFAATEGMADEGRLKPWREK